MDMHAEDSTFIINLKQLISKTKTWYLPTDRLWNNSKSSKTFLSTYRAGCTADILTKRSRNDADGLVNSNDDSVPLSVWVTVTVNQHVAINPSFMLDMVKRLLSIILSLGVQLTRFDKRKPYRKQPWYFLLSNISGGNIVYCSKQKLIWHLMWTIKLRWREQSINLKNTMQFNLHKV